MTAFDAETLAALAEIYQDTAAEIRAQIARHAVDAGTVPLQELQNTLIGVELRLQALTRARDELLASGLSRAAELGVQPLGLAAAERLAISEGAVRFVRAFTAADGLQLSDRLWRLDRHAREIITHAISSAVIQGATAHAAARELLAKKAAVPADIAAAIDAAGKAALGRQAETLLTGKGSPLFNAQRVFRTELNRAHGEAYIHGFMQQPDAGGLRFELSPRHPRADICNLHATANLFGLGPGVYPDRARCPWPAHPNTLSFVIGVFADEISETDRAGKETTAQALERMTADERRGALGLNKAEAFEAGRLPVALIDQPWSKVKDGLAPDNRDDLSRQYFNRRVDVETFGERYAVGGKTLTARGIARLTGAPDGATVLVEHERERLVMLIRHPFYKEDSLRSISGGVLYNELLVLKKDAPAGIGTRIFASQVEAARQLGLQRIEVYAAGSAGSDYNGYYTWARLGYRAPLKADEMGRLPAELRGARDVGDLMATAAGRDWWRKNGSGRAMSFDLGAGSESLRHLQAYLKEKGIQL